MNSRDEKEENKLREYGVEGREDNLNFELKFVKRKPTMASCQRGILFKIVGWARRKENSNQNTHYMHVGTSYYTFTTREKISG